MSTKHTQGTWHTGRTHAGEIAVFADNKQNTQICTIEPLMSNEETKANAARIVQCVNSHDELVRALKAAQSVIPYGNESIEIMVEQALLKAAK